MRSGGHRLVLSLFAVYVLFGSATFGFAKTGEIARFEIGLHMHRVWRTNDGYFVGSNFPSDSEFIKKETNFDVRNMGSSPNTRHKRWGELMAQNKGRIDVEMAKKFLADHWDSFEGKEDRDERSLCGHVANSPRGVPEWSRAPYSSEGAVTAQAADSTMAKNLSLAARAGYPCGEDFIADKFLKDHPEFEWQRPVLRDMKGNPWAEFKAADKQ